jgi:transposase
MYDAADIERVRELLHQGWSKAAIAKHLRISRRVIYNWAAAGLFETAALERRVRAGGGSKLDVFEPVIARELSANPAVSTRKLLRELRELGYTGEITQLRTFVAARRRGFLEPQQPRSSAATSTDEHARQVG